MECTHGATQRAAEYTRQAELDRFAKAIREVLEGNGAVLIPVFALGKSQELLYELNRMKAAGQIPDVPIYYGGLGAKVTELYDKLADSTPRNLPGYRLREHVETHGLPKKGVAPLIASPGNIYLVSSGMMSEHTVSHSLAEQVLPTLRTASSLWGTATRTPRRQGEGHAARRAGEPARQGRPGLPAQVPH